MKKFLFAVLAIVLVAGFGRVYYMKAALASKYSFNDLQRIAADSNKSLPTMIDPQTRLDSVVASERLLEKRYTLVAVQTSSALSEELKTKLFQILKTQSCQNPQSMNLYASGVGEAYTYFDMNGKLITTFTVDREVCK